jgi:NAD-dependent deacetylase
VLKVELVATPEAWQKNPDLVSDFYNQRRKQIIETEPNEAHRIITQLEKSHEVIIITQNIDDLHERAGSTNVLHLHGNIRFSKSSGPNQEKEYYPIDGWKLDSDDVCPNGYRLRPHVVWFGEDVPMYEKAVKEIEMADVFIVTGTSLQVYPAAGLIHYASRNAVKWIIDPNVNAFSVPNTFQKINKNASEGMTDLLNILIN